MKYIYDYCMSNILCKNFIIFILFSSILYAIYTIYITKVLKEGFKWNENTKTDFLRYQKTMFPNQYQFDLHMLQDQASEEDVQYLLKNGHWKWSDETKYIFLDNIAKNPIIKILPEEAMDNAMKIYNENVMKRILSLKDKEGEFLLYGVITGHSKNMPENEQNTIKCTSDKGDNDYYIQKVEYTGFNFWNGYKNGKITKLKNEDLPKEISGFQFIKEPCNPCNALKYPPDYSCPFTLNVEGDNDVSPIWKKLWNI